MPEFWLFSENDPQKRGTARTKCKVTTNCLPQPGHVSAHVGLTYATPFWLLNGFWISTKGWVGIPAEGQVPRFPGSRVPGSTLGHLQAWTAGTARCIRPRRPRIHPAWGSGCFAKRRTSQASQSWKPPSKSANSKHTESSDLF